MPARPHSRTSSFTRHVLRPDAESTRALVGRKGASPRKLVSTGRGIRALQPPLAIDLGLSHEELWEGSWGHRHTRKT